VDFSIRLRSKRFKFVKSEKNIDFYGLVLSRAADEANR